MRIYMVYRAFLGETETGVSHHFEYNRVVLRLSAQLLALGFPAFASRKIQNTPKGVMYFP